MFEDVVEFLRDAGDDSDDERELYSAEQIDDLRKQFPGIPEDFLQYLMQVGSGSVRDCKFVVMGDWLCPPTHIASAADPSERFLVFGDNFSGDYSGFLPDENWAVAEFWHANQHLHRVEAPFASYIREMIGMEREEASPVS